MKSKRSTEPNEGGRPLTDIRWTLSLAAREFGLGIDTLRRKLAQALILPGDDSRWSTQQICRAIYDDLDAEKIRLTRAQADKAELDLEERRKELVSASGVIKFCAGVATAIRQKIVVSSLKPEEIDAILAELETLFLDGTVTAEGFTQAPEGTLALENG